MSSSRRRASCMGSNSRLLRFVLLMCMCAENGGRGDASPAVEKSAGNFPPEIMIFQHFFLTRITFFCIIQHFQNEVAEIRGENEFWCRLVWMLMNPPPLPLAAPLLMWCWGDQDNDSLCNESREKEIVSMAWRRCKMFDHYDFIHTKQLYRAPCRCIRGAGTTLKLGRGGGKRLPGSKVTPTQS